MDDKISESLGELRRYWEVPAIAHYCALFGTTFKLLNFDLEDFEEGLVIDTENSSVGSRSPLIVDLLMSLLQGCVGRKEVTLLNYNQCLFDLLEIFWLGAGLGVNPLGIDRENASFHLLPVYAKVKILYWLCEMRMDRPDVEALTKDLPGENLRILPLGGDDKGSTYWYFYGTRLYKEEPEPLKLKISLDSKSKADSNKCGHIRKSQRSSKKRHGKSKKRSRLRSAPSVKAEVSHGSGTEESSRPSSEAEVGLNVSLTDSEANSFPGFSRVLSSQLSSSPQASPTEEDALRIMIRNIYSNEGDESTVPSTITSRAPTPSESSNMETEDSVMNEAVQVSFSQLESACVDSNMEINNPECDNKDSIGASSKELLQPDSCETNENSQTTVAGSLQLQTDNTKIEIEVNDITKSSTDAMVVKEEKPEPKQEEAAMEHSANADNEKTKDISTPPWIQDSLKPPKDNRWSIVCLTLADWNELGDKYKDSDSVKEQEFHELLHDGFLPAIGDLFSQQETEREKKYAEFAGRRTSDRLEMKKLLREKETKDFLRREAEERHKQQKIELEKEMKRQKEEREARMKEREKEQERRNLLKVREREERARRLEMRSNLKLQYQDPNFKPTFDLMSPDTLNASSASFYEKEMQQLDLEIELDHMNGQLEKVLDSLKANEDAWPFFDPVTPDIAPNYHEVIKCPMDLSTIETKLIGRVYNKKAEFIRDINLMLTNCLEYNGLSNEYTRAAQRLERAFIKSWKKYFPPSDVHEVDDRARNEELQCISLLGELDRRIKHEQMKNRPPPERNSSDEEVRILKDSKRPQKRVCNTPSSSGTVYSYQIINSGGNNTQSPIAAMSGIVNRQGARTPQPLKPRILQQGYTFGTSRSNTPGTQGLRLIAPQTPGSNMRSAQEIPANIVTPTRTASAQETPQAAAKLIRTVGPDGQPRVLLTVPKGGCYISQENFEKLMATSKNLVGGQSGPILMASGDGNQPGMKTVSFAVKPAVSGSPLTSSPKQNSNISVAQMGAAQTSGSGGQTPTVIPLPDGKFIQRDRNGDLSLMLRNKTTGVLMNLGRLSSEVLEKANISKLLSGDLSIQQFQTSYSGTDGCQVGSSGQPATLDPASLLVSPPRENQQQNSSNVQLFSPRNLLPANKSVTQPIIVSTPSIKLTTPAKPICSVAPVLQQSVLSQASSSMAPSHTAYTILSGQQSGTANSQALNGSTVLIQSPPVLVLGTNQVGTVGQQMIRIGNQQYILPATTQYVSGSGGQQATNVRNNGAPVQVIQFVPQILVNSQQPVIIQTSSDDTFTAETGACVTVSSTTSSEPTSSRQPDLSTNIGSNVVKENPNS